MQKQIKPIQIAVAFFAITSIAIDVLAIVGWALSIVWCAIAFFWLAKEISKKRYHYLYILIGIFIPITVFSFSYFLDKYIENDISEFYLKFSGNFPKNKAELLANDSFNLSWITKNRLLWYDGMPDPKMTIRSFPFDLKEFNLVSKTIKIRSY